ncbi:hypothetical protein [Yersinia enterocolitica]|uniref:hypothetical protein n=1 Tax=Yersinia enterocolitica TaxID=630 RepID=UPI0005AD52F0|nr:hypothetical protein [Yersinia enterocolitica]AJJ25052.1 hypothetical protein CH49_1339 [Yersinia enterocolitica]CNG00331.1 Uncharacterised protein [Yersinia enterocolitica]CRY32319.1 Uncharacterised protein [Yersinia enterocolitica]HDL8282404.1 hypothetical protein [Yersinia enterocolitica]
MKQIDDVLSGLELYFRRTDQQCIKKTPWFTRWLYIPVEERMQILDDLLMPYPTTVQKKK